MDKFDTDPSLMLSETDPDKLMVWWSHEIGSVGDDWDEERQDWWYYLDATDFESEAMTFEEVGKFIHETVVAYVERGQDD